MVDSSAMNGRVFTSIVDCDGESWKRLNFPGL